MTRSSASKFHWPVPGGLSAMLLLLALPSDGVRAVESVDGAYAGRHAGVNGIAVLYRMFEDAGWACMTWKRLSPKLQECQAIVWTPREYRLPDDQQLAWMDAWLRGRPGRTLVFVGRDYDALSDYWRQVEPLVPPAQRPQIAERRRQAEAYATRIRMTALPISQCAWLTYVRDSRPARTVSSLGDRGGWRKYLQTGSGVAIRLRSELAPPSFGGRAELLLAAAGGEVIAYRVPRGQGQILVINNGSFLLNLGLVNHEHQKLAAALIADCGPPAKIAFLNRSSEIFEREPANRPPSGLSLFTAWPLGLILGHAVLAGVVACFMILPIFGRPRVERDTLASDFGQHVDALGALLARSGDRPFARERLRAWRELQDSRDQETR